MGDEDITAFHLSCQEYTVKRENFYKTKKLLNVNYK